MINSPVARMIRVVSSPGSDRRQGIANGDQTSRRLDGGSVGSYRGCRVLSAVGHASLTSIRLSGGNSIEGHESVDVFIGVDALKKLTSTQIEEISRRRERDEELSLSIAWAEAIGLAEHVLDLDELLDFNDKQLDALVKVSEAAPLLEEKGFGAVTAAKCFVALSREGRVCSEAAFACLAGVNPIPSSSGDTTRHRLSLGETGR